MLDLVEQIKKRMKWRKPPEITDVGYEIARLKQDALDFVLRLDDLEKHQSSKSVSEKDTI